MGRRKERFLGLDIGHHAIKAVEVEGYDSSNWRISGLGIIPTPADCIADGVVAQPYILSEAIRSLTRRYNFQAKRAVCSVSGPAVHFRPVRLPRMHDAQLRKAVMFKAREAPTATPIEEMIVEYDVQDVDPTAPDLDILMVAAPRAIVESRADAVASAGLLVEAVDLDGFALMRALVEYSLNPEDRERTVAIVSLGHTYTEFNIVTHGVFSFPRSIPIGGSHFSHAIRSTMGPEANGIEEIKQNIDLRKLLETDPYSTESGPEQMLRPAMEELVRELMRSINYYQSQFSEGAREAELAHLLLCGGCARMIGMKEYMSARLRMDVEIADPLASYLAEHPGPDLEEVREQSPAMVSALGLALYGLPN